MICQSMVVALVLQNPVNIPPVKIPGLAVNTSNGLTISLSQVIITSVVQ